MSYAIMYRPTLCCRDGSRDEGILTFFVSRNIASVIVFVQLESFGYHSSHGLRYAVYLREG
jgi:hypothetical protein